jgi:hypothetical protein
MTPKYGHFESNPAALTTRRAFVSTTMSGEQAHAQKCPTFCSSFGAAIRVLILLGISLPELPESVPFASGRCETSNPE